MERRRTLVPAAAKLALVLTVACAPDGTLPGDGAGMGGKADGWDRALREQRQVSVVLNDPHCDVCTQADKDALRPRSEMIARIVELIDRAEHSIDAAQFTFSVDEIRDALLAASRREGVTVRLAMDRRQERGTDAAWLRDRDVDVRFIRGREDTRDVPPEDKRHGLQHAKFMIVDGSILWTGSNNWSSTGTTFNEENAIIVEAGPDDPQIAAFQCHFEAIWESRLEEAGACSREGIAFTPGTAAIGLIKAALDEATHSVDVLMHHLTFDGLVRKLAQIAEDPEREVRVRIVLNATDRHETTGRYWDRLRAAGAEIRFKQRTAELAQLMHHKLVIVDGRVLVNGSGNWSGAFFNNYENYVRYEDPRIVAPFRATFERIWTWSLDAQSLDTGRTAAQQHFDTTRAFFGNLHAHFAVADGDALLDDGNADRIGDDGEPYHVEVGDTLEDAARFAFEYGRDAGGLDFLVLSPHTQDFRASDPPDMANMDETGYAALRAVAAEVTAASGGDYLAVGAMEWSTNSTGNHVNVFGSEAVSNVERGRFDLFWDGFLPDRAWAGERPVVMLNHPRTFRVHEEFLSGNWDRIFGIPLTDIESNSQRRNKFNDYGLDDYAPLSDVRDSWIAGETLPDAAVVDETFANLNRAAGPWARLMEVTVARGKEIGHEHSQNPSLTVAEDGSVSRYTKVHRDWDYYLSRGWRLAPASSHDNHRANWGTGHSTRTVVFARSLEHERDLLGAIDRRAVMASEDENLIARLYADGRAPMGTELGTVAERMSARLWVEDPDHAGPFVVRLWAGRVGGDAVEPIGEHALESEGWIDLDLPLPTAGTWFFYAEIHEAGPDRMAWTAPIWVERL